MPMRERIMEAASGVLALKAADETQVTVLGCRSSSVRFANSAFHQGGVETDCAVYVRAVVGGASGVASANSLDAGTLAGCAARAAASARRMKGRSSPCALPGQSVYPAVLSFFERTARLGTEEKTNMLHGGFKEAARHGALVSGAFRTDAGEVAVLNSRGVEAYHPYTAAHLNIVATADGASGSGSAVSKDAGAIDVKAVAARAVRDALSAKGPADHPPGRYRVLLEPHAVAELLYWLSYSGFGAKNFIEGTSPLSGRIGERVTGASVTIREDGPSPLGMAAPFDMEGAPKSAYTIIEKGVARGVAHDSQTAVEAGGASSTGNAALPDDQEGPLPDHLFMEGGRYGRDEMTGVLEAGILVKSFHYVNGFLNTSESMMTGMTRHGTFLVEGGRVVRPLKPMRFTENVLDAFMRIVASSRETELFGNHGFPLSSISAPAVVIDGFDFSG